MLLSLPTIIGDLSLFHLLAGLLILVVLFGGLAFLSAAEAAFFSLPPADLEKIRSPKTRSGKKVIFLLENPKKILATVLILSNLLNIAIVILATFLINEAISFREHPLMAFLLEVFTITGLILVLGEIMPKIYATGSSRRVLLFSSRILYYLVRITEPISTLMIRFTSIIDRRINKKGHPISISDLSTAIEITSATGSPAEEQKILKGIVRFGNIEVKEIMRARVDVVAVDTAIGFEDLKRLILDTGYSRIPVYAGTFDNIRGILYVKDILPHLDEKGDFSWNRLLRDAFFVPENKKINDLLREFQEKKIHLAIVVDEYGGTSGIVTLEDIIEEIVGEISDEYDTESDKAEFTKIGDGTYFFEGKTSLNDFCKILGVDDSLFDVVKGESDTLAGMVLEIKGKIPEPREEITVGNLILRIESVDKRRIKKIRVTVGPGKTGEKE